MNTVNHEHVKIALDRVTGSVFENFINAFASALHGEDFIPMGGVHDGGADAFQDTTVFSARKAETFYQASVQQAHRTKIRDTVARLQKFGRTPRLLTYFTSIDIPNADREEEILTDELGVFIRIRDKKYIVNQINYNAATVEAFNTYLSPLLAFLNAIGGAETLSPAPNLPARTLCVFLGQEIERRRGNTQLLEAVTDSLILWALEGTDPNQNKFLTTEEIRETIEDALPSARHFIRGTLAYRLNILSAKGNTTGREIRAHNKGTQFCLPYETREIIRVENTEDEKIKLRVSEAFMERATQNIDLQQHDFSASELAAACHRTVEHAFREQGLLLSAFVSGQDVDFPTTIMDHAEAAICELGYATYGDAFKESCMTILRDTFYHSHEVERAYLHKLSRTYSLLFTLRNEPKIVEYFRSMSGKFVLYVGSDLIIRALSELYLPEEDRMTFNMFKILRKSGSELILNEMTLEEVITHIVASDREFINNYLDIEPHVDFTFARHIDRILIRAYFYARLDLRVPNGPRGWKSYINNFCSPGNLYRTEGRNEVKDYLCEEFGMMFERRSDVEKTIDPGRARNLAEAITPHKLGEKANQRAYNDALQVLRVYSKRDELSERNKPNPYGYRCWWLTQETSVLRATSWLVREEGSRYIMRPEFVLNFISLSPTEKEVRDSYDKVFPSLLGVKLSNRLKEDVFKKIVEKVREAHMISDARARAIVAQYSNILKGDQIKRYELDVGN